MPKITKITETDNGFSFEREIVDHNEKKSSAKISIPYPEVVKRNLIGKKLKITIEVIE